MKQLTKYSWVMMLVLFISLFNACKKSTSEPEVIASFTYAVDATNYKLVTFTSTAQNFATLSWNFGDASALSTEINPTHTYATLGDFTVTLTATSPGGKTDLYSTKITIADPNAQLTKLVGDVSKTWKLLRTATNNRYPLEVGPTDHSSIWWAMGLNNNELANRPCMLNDEWTFGRDGSMVYNANGDYWAEGGLFNPANVCASSSSMVGANGEDLTAWGSGSHTFTMTTGASPTITAVGKGAFIGFEKLGNGIETSSTNPIVVPTSITYKIIKLTDDAVDTLIIEGAYSGGPGYWRFILVHYDDPTQEPPIPGPKPTAAFTFTLNGHVLTCVNTTTDGVTYLWDFGDGTTSTASDPTHTYAADGIYTIKLTATNPNGSADASSLAFVSSSVLTDAILQGGAWKPSIGDKTIFVGPAPGDGSWWSCPKANLDGTNAGTVDDWSCLPDDQFKFIAGGTFSYNTMGSTRNDGYFGGTTGCIDDAGIAASTLGAPLGSFAGYTYTFTPATGSARATIVLTSPSTAHAPFIGFYKGYNGVASGVKGGENNGTDPANFGSLTNTYQVMGYANTGTKEYLFVTVDITADHLGTNSWSCILER